MVHRARDSVGTIGFASPSAEISILQRARQRALAEANASGSGRRAKIPSCRALEAAGQANDGDGAQLMSKQKRDQEAKMVAQRKEERKAAAAAGLKFGETLEEFTDPSGTEDVADDGRLEDIRPVTSVSGDVGTACDLSNRNNWRKLTPAEMIQQAQMISYAAVEIPSRQTNVNGANMTTPVHAAAAHEQGFSEANADGAIAATEDTGTAAKKVNNGVPDTSVTQMVDRDEMEIYLGQEGRRLAAGARGGESGITPVCEHKGCTRGATSWANDIEGCFW